ncbi:hypothetical protein IHE45_16G036700 [Dioscorea alata]|uniref:Uncharacterized protein n=1 Tax=Dioscorea alata TaxID=55571 RepID=A0ACB7UGY6_DIOAL|nr:hypothetical protein IHE45_16G036700 [Dioscorea alata]
MSGMATTRSASPIRDGGVDAAPLLGPRGGGGEERGGRRMGRRPSLRGAARFLRRASSRRMMREPSMLVRETAAEQLEERQSDWAYSRPVVFLDVLWNMAFVGVAVGVLILSRDEKPVMPLRLWVGGYALQCLLHMVCVLIEYRRRNHSRGEGSGSGSGSGSRSRGSSGPSSPRVVDDSSGYGVEQGQEEERTSIAKHLESANTMFSFIWWIIGFYWVSAGGQALTRFPLFSWHLMCSLLYSVSHLLVLSELLFVAVYHASLQFYMLWRIRKEHPRRTSINFQNTNFEELDLLKNLVVRYLVLSVE